MSRGARTLGVCLGFFAVVGGGAAAAATAALQDGESPPPSTAANELGELGETLKAAVLSGTLSEEDAIKIYRTMAARLTPDAPKGKTDRSKGAGSAKLDFMRLSAVRPEQIAALFRPEFRRRDLSLLANALDLDSDQAMIAEILLADYREAFELASAPLRDGLGRYQRVTTDQWVVGALARAQITDVDRAVARTEDALERLARGAAEKDVAGEASGDAAERERKRAARDAWARRMVEVSAKMEERLAALRDRVESELATMEGQSAEITGDDLVRMARVLRRERARLRAEAIESLAPIAAIEPTDEAKARFDIAMARVRIEHLLPHGRLGGESTNLWAALVEAARDFEPDRSQASRPFRLEDAEATLHDAAPWIAEKLDARADATLDRELAGLAFLAARERVAAAGETPNSGPQIMRPFAEAARRELAASVAVRDALLTLLDQTATYIDETHPDTRLSERYRDTALRRGFATEMRQRWSERALAAATQLPSIDDETRQAILAVDAETRAELERLRADAIAKRLERDPQFALEQIDSRLAAAKPKTMYSPELWLGSNFEAFASLDERVEGRLLAILTPEQIETVPARQRGKKVGQGTGAK